MENRNILCVDDEADVLFGFRRNLRSGFELELALGSEEGLNALKSGKKFAVILADMRMPGMDGIEFLSEAQKICPDSVRMMLTGNADLQTAMDAVNEGHVFRFLSKPCLPENLNRALEAGVRQYQLVIAEHELLRNTLLNSVQVLIDLLSMTSPAAFSRAIRIKELIMPVLSELGVANEWMYEMAAMLSQLGCVTIPTETIERAYRGEQLSSSEHKMFDAHPGIGKGLIAHIPRMEIIAEMIGRQREKYHGKYITKPQNKEEHIILGAELLHAAGDFELEMQKGHTSDAAVEILHSKPDKYNSHIVNLLAEHNVEHKHSHEVQVIPLSHLNEGMMLKEDLRVNNVLLVGKGQKVSETLLQRLENLWNHNIVDKKQMITVVSL